jgi:hypothetical protein
VDGVNPVPEGLTTHCRANREPDLQGSWTDEFDTPFQRPPRYANQEFCSEERPAAHGTELDVACAYNHAVFLSNEHVGARTSLIVGPPDGRIPRLTPEARKTPAAGREFRLALLQSTETCKSKSVRCSGGKYDPTPSPRRADPRPASIPRSSTAMTDRRTAAWASAADGRISASWQGVVISAPCIRLPKSGSQNRLAFHRPVKAGSIPAR